MTSREKKPEGDTKHSFPERRKNFRVTCPFTIDIAIAQTPEKSGPWHKAKILDLSLGGLRVALELDNETLKDLPGSSCTLRFNIGGKYKALPGRFVGIYTGPSERETEATKKPLEAGIRFEGLSVDDQFILVDLFGKKRSPIFR